MAVQENSNTRRSAGGSIGTFRLFGIPVRLHFTFMLFLLFLIVTGLGSDQSAVDGGIYLTALFASLLAHEFAHALVSSRYGISTIEVVMFPIGGISRLQRSARPVEEFWTALAGPLMNFAIGWALLYAHSRNVWLTVASALDLNSGNLLIRIGTANLIFGVFNLIPAFPMDGGRMLRAVLARFRTEDDATRIAAWSGRMLAISLSVYGLFSAHFLLVFVAFFIYIGAAQESASAMGRSLATGIPVRAAMLTDYRTLGHGNTIRDAAKLVLATAQQDFPIVHGEQVIGFLGRRALVRAMASHGFDAYVAGFMERTFPTLSPEMNLAEVLPFMAQTGSCALVMEGERLLGLLTSENLSQFLVLRRFGLEPDR